MSFVADRWIRVSVLGLLAMALVLPAPAGADTVEPTSSPAAAVPVRALADADDQIPGVQLPAASPVTGTLSLAASDADTTFDEDDVYQVHLEAGQTFSARVSTASSAIDCELYLFAPGTIDIYDWAEGQLVAAAELEYTNPDMLLTSDGGQFVAPTTGEYFLDVVLFDAPAADTPYPYTVDFAIGDAPEVTLTESASTVSFDGIVTFTGAVTGQGDAPMAGQSVELWAVAYPYDTYKRRLSGTTTQADGSYSMKTTVTRKTRFKVVCVANEPGYAHGESAQKWVKAKAALGAPKWYSGTKRHGRAFTVYGYIKPRHPLGQKHVKITASRLDAGVWRVAKSVKNTSTHTKYSTTIVLPYRGKWRLVASTPDDGYHAATTSRATYVTVK